LEVDLGSDKSCNKLIEFMISISEIASIISDKQERMNQSGEISITLDLNAIYPDGLYDIIIHLKDEYIDKLLYITKNWLASDDKVDEYGRVYDKERIDYYASHIKAVERAVKSGVSVAGYYTWSLMDNFELAWGLGIYQTLWFNIYWFWYKRKNFKS